MKKGWCKPKLFVLDNLKIINSASDTMPGVEAVVLGTALGCTYTLNIATATGTIPGTGSFKIGLSCDCYLTYLIGGNFLETHTMGAIDTMGYTNAAKCS